MVKKILLSIMVIFSIASVWAEHGFNVCYHNLSSTPISYINDGVSHKWKSRGELIGSGEVSPNETKCFKKIADETMFSTDYITFTLGKEDGAKTYTRWVGIANCGLAKPYVFAQDATETKAGTLIDHTKDGKDNYSLHVFINNDGSFLYSNSADAKDTDSIIVPRKFK